MPEPTSTLLTADGRWFSWPHSSARTTPLSGERIAALLAPDACTRILAHADLTAGQLVSLFNGTPNKLRRARYLKCCALRIRRHDLAELCKGIRENLLVHIFRQSDDRAVLIALLLEHAPTDG